MRPLSTTPPCQVIARRRARALGFATIPAVVLGAVLTANPAFAVEAAPQTKSGVTAAFGNATIAGTTFTLTNDLTTSDGSYDRQVLGDGKKLTIDLQGHELDLDEIEVGDGSTLIVKDTQHTQGKGLNVGEKSLPAKDGLTGIELGDKATFNATGNASVSTTGSAGQAGLGSVGADRPTITVDGGAKVTTAGSPTAVSLGDSTGDSNSPDGGYLVVGEGSTLSIPAESTVKLSPFNKVTNSGTVALAGSIVGTASIQNQGVILPTGEGSIDAGVNVSGNAFQVKFSLNTGTAAANSTIPDSQTVYAATLAEAGVYLADYQVTKAGYISDGWEALVDDEWTKVTNATDLADLTSSTDVELRAALRLKVAAPTGTITAATAGVPYKASVTSTGAGPLTYALAAGSALPDDLHLDADGTITGTPKTVTDGAVPFTVVATSKYTDPETGKLDSKTSDFTISVGAPTTLADATLDESAVGRAVSVTLHAGGTGPFTYAPATGSTLPTGLTLVDGVLSGSPTTAGDYTFSIAATSTGGFRAAADNGNIGTFHLVVHSVPTFDSTKLESAPVGQTNYSGSVSASAAAADGPLTYVLKDRGTLPAVLKFDDGVVTGPVTETNKYSFTVTATNTWGSTDQVITLNVGAVPDIKTPSSLQKVAVGDPVAQTITASGVGVKFASSDLPDGLTIDSKTGAITGATKASSAGSRDGVFSFTVKASNEFGTVSQPFTLATGKKASFVTALVLSPGSTDPKLTYSTTIVASGDGTEKAKLSVVGDLPAGLTFDATTGVLSGHPTTAGEYTINIAASDSWGGVTQPFTLHVGTAPSGWVTTLPAPVVDDDEDTLYSATLLGSTADDVKFSYTGDLPTGLRLVRGALVGEPTTAGTYKFTVTATSETYGSTSQDYTLVADLPTTLGELALNDAVQGSDYGPVSIPRTGGDHPGFKVTKGALPDGITLSDAGVLSGKPTADAETSTFTVTADGSAYGSDDVILTIVVQAPAHFVTDRLNAVTLKSTDDGLLGTVDQVIEVAGSGDVSLTPVSLPAGLHFDAKRSAIYGTLDAAGSYPVTLAVKNAYTDGQVKGTFTLKAGEKPKLALVSFPVASTDAEYPYTLEAAVDDVIEWKAAGLPSGLQLDPKTGTITGKPREAGTYPVKVTARSIFGSTTSAAVDLKVTAPAVVVPTPDPVVTTPAPEPTKTVTSPTPAPASDPAPSTATPVVSTSVSSQPAPAPAQTAPVAAPAPVLPTIAATTVKVGHDLAISLAASSNTAVTYSVAEGSLPKGLSLNSTSGLISGTPSESGTFALTVKATNAAGSSLTKLSIVVPKVQELVKASPEKATARIGKPIDVTVKGLKKGEAWTIKVDGKTKAHGTAKKAGDLVVSVKLPRSVRDKAHTVKVTANRKVTDPAQTATTSFTVSTITLRKSLAVSVSGTVGTVKRLAAGEKVVVTLNDRTVVGRGVASASGVFTFTTKRLTKGSHTLHVTGATEKRTGSLKVKID